VGVQRHGNVKGQVGVGANGNCDDRKGMMSFPKDLIPVEARQACVFGGTLLGGTQKLGRQRFRQP